MTAGHTPNAQWSLGTARASAQRVGDSLLSVRWPIPLLVLTLVITPITALGEIAAADTRARIDRDETARSSAAAVRIADVVGARHAAVIDALEGFSRSPALADAIRTGDLRQLAAALDLGKSALSSDIQRVIVLGEDFRFLAQVPVDPALASASRSDLAAALPISPSALARGTYIVRLPGAPPALGFFAPIRPMGTSARGSSVAWY